MLAYGKQRRRKELKFMNYECDERNLNYFLHAIHDGIKGDKNKNKKIKNVKFP